MLLAPARVVALRGPLRLTTSGGAARAVSAQDETAIMRNASTATTVSACSTSSRGEAPLLVTSCSTGDAKTRGGGGDGKTLRGRLLGSSLAGLVEDASAGPSSGHPRGGGGQSADFRGGDGFSIGPRMRLGARALWEPLTALGAAALLLGERDGATDATFEHLRHEVASEELHMLQYRRPQKQFTVDSAMLRSFKPPAGAAAAEEAASNGAAADIAVSDDVAAIFDTSADDDVECCGCSCCSNSDDEVDVRVDGSGLPSVARKPPVGALSRADLNSHSKRRRARVYVCTHAQGHHVTTFGEYCAQMSA